MANPPVPFFYQMREYVPEINTINSRTANREYLHFSEHSRGPFKELMQQYFDTVTFQRAGVLHGEYMVFNGLALIGRDGERIKANMAEEDEAGGNQVVDNFYDSEDFSIYHHQTLKTWDSFKALEHVPIISHPYAYNYFHWTLETITRIRLLEHVPSKNVLVLALDLKRLFQRDLLLRTLGNKTALIQDKPGVKVKDPFLSHQFISEDGVHWLRKKMNISTENGKRRIYLRRSPGGTRSVPGGGVSETPDFLALLKEYRFETVEFGAQELGVEEQVKMLDKVAVILAPHGAAMANLAYLNPPLSVIEIMGSATVGAYYIHLASILRFHYYGLYSTSYDAERNIIVDIDELRAAMKDCEF